MVCSWIQRNLVHGPGDVYGQPAKLRPDEKAFIYRCYELDPQTGRRKVRRALKGLPKGNNKTELAAWISLTEFCGPVVFAGWDRHGKPMGRRRESPDIPVGAASFEQADLLYGTAREIARADGCALKPLLKDCVFDVEMLLPDGPGRLYRVAAAQGTNDGKRPTFFVADELHEWVGAKERVHLILENGLSKRADTWSLGITTAGFDLETLLGRLYLYGKRVLAGDIIDPTFLMDWVEAEVDGLDLDDPDVLEAAIRAANPAVDVIFPAANLLARYHQIPRNEFIRYHLNGWTEADELWEAAALWDDLADPAIEFDPALPLCVGIDVGVKHDSSGVVAAQMVGDRLPVRAKIWENPWPVGHKLHDTWRFAIAEAEDYCRELYRQFPKAAREDEHGRLLPGPAFFYDPHFFERSAQDLAAEGLNMVEFPQSDARMIPASQALFELAKTGVIAHDGDKALRRHIRNVVAEQKPRGWRISKQKAHKKVDGAVATAIAASEATRPAPTEASEPQIFYLEFCEHGQPEGDPCPFCPEGEAVHKRPPEATG